MALQQQLIFVLILGRWMLPKGKLTRDQLSQLLLVYIGIAADILEFSTEGLKVVISFPRWRKHFGERDRPPVEREMCNIRTQK